MDFHFYSSPYSHHKKNELWIDWKITLQEVGIWNACQFRTYHAEQEHSRCRFASNIGWNDSNCQGTLRRADKMPCVRQFRPASISVSILQLLHLTSDGEEGRRQTNGCLKLTIWDDSRRNSLVAKEIQESINQLIKRHASTPEEERKDIAKALFYSSGFVIATLGMRKPM